jgi:hypothetical protein
VLSLKEALGLLDGDALPVGHGPELVFLHAKDLRELLVGEILLLDRECVCMCECVYDCVWVIREGV